MTAIEVLGATLGLAFVSGINLYATVLTVGLATRLGWVVLPEHLQGLAVLGHPAVLVLAAVVYTLEFFADKIPWVDTLWDSIHTFVRPFGAAALALAATADTDPIFRTFVILACGAVALGSHSAKAGTRLVANHSPEPFSNIALSFAEDAVAFSGAWLAISHPSLMLVVVTLAIAVLAWFLPRLLRLLRFSLLALRGRIVRFVSGGSRVIRPPLEWSRHRPRLSSGAEALAIRYASGPGLPWGRYRHGYLYVGDDILRFITRVWWRLRWHDLPLASVQHVDVRRRLLADVVTLRLVDGEMTFTVFKDTNSDALVAHLAPAVLARKG